MDGVTRCTNWCYGRFGSIVRSRLPIAAAVSQLESGVSPLRQPSSNWNQAFSNCRTTASNCRRAAAEVRRGLPIVNRRFPKADACFQFPFVRFRFQIASDLRITCRRRNTNPKCLHAVLGLCAGVDGPRRDGRRLVSGVRHRSDLEGLDAWAVADSTRCR